MQVGGEDQEFDSDEELDLEEVEDFSNILNNDQENDEDGEQENNQDNNADSKLEEENMEVDMEINEDFDLSELAEVYNNIDVESNKSIENTSKLLTKALEDKNGENVQKNIISFDRKR